MKIILIRPGALGDTLLVMPVIRLLKDGLNTARLLLLAPGARAKLLARRNWADRALDWDSSLFANLFHQNLAESEIPTPLKEIFSDADLVVSLSSLNNPLQDAGLYENLALLAPHALIHIAPFQPPLPHAPVRQALHHSVALFCLQHNLLAPESVKNSFQACDAQNLVIPHSQPPPILKPYLAIHPGSGSKRKNWPETHFLGLAERLMKKTLKGTPLFRQLVVTAGEADGTLGELVARNVPNTILMRDMELNTLAEILANARLYVGNDSGVSHLAASVETAEGKRPRVAALFGPTDSTLWGPKNALCIQAGEKWTGADPETAAKEITEFVTDFLLKDKKERDAQ